VLTDFLEDEDGMLLPPLDEPPSPAEVASLKRLIELLETAVAEGDDPKFKVSGRPGRVRMMTKPERRRCSIRRSAAR
jgi:hypothetical protein